MDLRIGYLYPDLMNTYGDIGNIIALKKRAQWRNIEVKITNLSIGDTIDPEEHDLYFFGGGQDWQQGVVAEDLQGAKTDALRRAKENGAVFFSICGGYQLLGQYYQPFEGDKLYGVGLIDCYTKASTKRMIGNLVVGLGNDLQIASRKAQSERDDMPYAIRDSLDTLIGFENHSGQTFLGPNAIPLGKVLKGFGNNGEDHTEGAIDGLAIGCYLHGSCLPKNPHLADYLLYKALERRYNQVQLKPLDDTLEYKAHEIAKTR